MRANPWFIAPLLALLLSCPVPAEPQQRQELEKQAREEDALVAKAYSRGDWQEAVERLHSLLAIHRKRFPKETHPDGHPELAANLSSLGRTYRSLGDVAKAEAYHREALAMRQKLYPDGHI